MHIASRLGKLPPSPTTLDHLDQEVLRECFNYGVANKYSRILEADGNLSGLRLEVLSRQLLRLADACDRRLMAEGLPGPEDKEIAWVEVAVAGLKRNSHLAPELKGLHKENTFRPGHADDQRDIYREMSEARELGLLNSPVVDRPFVFD
jgi:hypothetical protein